MRLVRQSATLIFPISYSEALQKAYIIGGACVARKPSDLTDRTKLENWVDKRLSDGETNPVEHISLSVEATVNVGLARELVRHRVASVYTQESTRYVNYAKKGVSFVFPGWTLKDLTVDCLFKNENGSEISLFEMFHVDYDSHYPLVEVSFSDGFPYQAKQFMLWYNSCISCERDYIEAMQSGYGTDFSRDFLNFSLSTKIVMTKPINMWRDFLIKRTNKKCHPAMISLSNSIFDIFRVSYPAFFEGIK